LLLACSSAQKGTSAPHAKSAQRDGAVAACSAAEDCDGGDTGKPGGKGLCTSSGDCEEAIPVNSAQHMDGTIDYPDPPPAGGNHNPCWGAWGVHAQALGVEHWVHNLEHGGVVFLYHCSGGCAADVAKLAAFVKGHRLTILTEYDAMPKRFAVVAWGFRLQSDTLDLGAFEMFYTAHVDHAPESIDSGPPAGCPP
jgi:hypothetical protein